MMFKNAFRKAAIIAGFVLTASLLLTACSNNKPLSIESYSRDASADFSNLKTYKWDFSGLSEKEPTGGHLPEFSQVLCEHVDQHLSSLGYQRVDSGSSDFILDYRIVIEQGEASTNHNDATEAFSNAEAVNQYSLRWQFDKRAAPSMEGPKDHMTPYQRGTLHLGALNDKNQVIWHYSVSKILNQRSNEAERRAAMRIAIDKLMKKFPNRN